MLLPGLGIRTAILQRVNTQALVTGFERCHSPCQADKPRKGTITNSHPLWYMQRCHWFLSPVRAKWRNRQHIGQPQQLSFEAIMDASVNDAFVTSRDTVYELLEVGFAGEASRLLQQRASSSP
jgi:hypothetical protein